MFEKYFVHGDGWVIVSFVVIFWVMFALALCWDVKDTTWKRFGEGLAVSGAAILIVLVIMGVGLTIHDWWFR